MLRPIATAAKTRTLTAIDMLASEPSWVNGTANATTKADSVRAWRFCAAAADSQPITPTRAATQTTTPQNTANETNEPR